MSERLIVVDGYNVILRAPQLKPGPERTLTTWLQPSASLKSLSPST